MMKPHGTTIFGCLRAEPGGIPSTFHIGAQGTQLGRMAGLSAPEDVCLSLSLRSVLRMEDGIIHLRGESFRLLGRSG